MTQVVLDVRLLTLPGYLQLVQTVFQESFGLVDCLRPRSEVFLVAVAQLAGAAELSVVIA